MPSQLDLLQSNDPARSVKPPLCQALYVPSDYGVGQTIKYFYEYLEKGRGFLQH